jgi:transposase
MVVLGVDPHKHTHTCVAVDERGRAVPGAELTVPARRAGHAKLIEWARSRFPDAADRRWAVEDVRHVSGGLISALVVAGETVVPVPPKLMAGARRSARARGKSDPIDALAVARAALREDLPCYAASPVAREAKLLTDHRDRLVGRRTEVINRLRWDLHELDPERGDAIRARSLDRTVVLDQLQSWLQAQPASLLRDLLLDQVADVRALSARIKTYDKKIKALAEQVVPTLVALPGCGPATAVKILGEVGDITRFRSDAALAMHAGVAPIPVQSGRSDRVRLCRSGNRQLNVALHRIALTQGRLPGAGRDYQQARRQHGDSPMHALRAHKRLLTRVVREALLTDHRAAQKRPDQAPADVSAQAA